MESLEYQWALGSVGTLLSLFRSSNTTGGGRCLSVSETWRSVSMSDANTTRLWIELAEWTFIDRGHSLIEMRRDRMNKGSEDSIKRSVDVLAVKLSPPLLSQTHFQRLW